MARENQREFVMGEAKTQLQWCFGLKVCVQSLFYVVNHDIHDNRQSNKPLTQADDLTPIEFHAENGSSPPENKINEMSAIHASNAECFELVSGNNAYWRWWTRWFEQWAPMKLFVVQAKYVIIGNKTMPLRPLQRIQRSTESETKQNKKNYLAWNRSKFNFHHSSHKS